MAGTKRKQAAAAELSAPAAARASGTSQAAPVSPASDERCLVPAGCDWTVILGIDPGTRALGYGAIVLAPDGPRLVLAGVIRPSKSDLAQRLCEIAAELPRVLARCRPQWVVVERAFSAVNVQSAFRIGESRGVVLACAATFGARVAEYSPAQSKKAVLGNGAASKEQVAAMIPRLLRRELGTLPLDATDALALALTQARTLEREHLTRSRSGPSLPQAAANRGRAGAAAAKLRSRREPALAASGGHGSNRAGTIVHSLRRPVAAVRSIRPPGTGPQSTKQSR